MDYGDGYNYKDTERLIKPFSNILNIDPFLADDSASYGLLWEFKEEIDSWSFGVSPYKNYVFLRYKIKNQPGYLVMNFFEKVETIEHHHNHYITLVLREVSSNMELMDHVHSIVIDLDDPAQKFDLENLMSLLEGTALEGLNPMLSSKYFPWVQPNAESLAKRLRSILQNLEHHALLNLKDLPSVGRKKQTKAKKRKAADDNEPSPSKKKSGMKKSEPKVGTPTGRKRKQTKSSGTAGGASSASVLTTNTVGAAALVGPLPEFQEVAQAQKEFWDNHESCFVLGMQTVNVNIDKCMIARDEYVIRTLQQNIVNNMKNVLVQMVHKDQRQKVCLTPVDENDKLLLKPPKKWDEIKDNKFMIINGQHSITASKQLQKDENCDADRKEALKTWEALIVWTQDVNKLRSISKFYNLINHLDHAQPTWGNQLISCRNIWFACRRPTNNENDPTNRNNNSIFNSNKYKSFVSAVMERFQNINPKKEGAKVTKTSDLKHEIQIITLRDDYWTAWEKFLTNHAKGTLIDPMTDKMYCEKSGFNENDMLLKREFFKRCAHFTDKDFWELARHLINETPNRQLAFPKVSVRKPVAPVDNHYVAHDWVERRKRKKVILQDLVALKPRLGFLNADGDVVDDVWNSWKVRHRFTGSTWDFLLSYSSAEYFKKRLRNEALIRRITDLAEEFPDVLYMLETFLELKYHLPAIVGKVQMRSVNSVAKSLVSHSDYTYSPEPLNLAVFDARIIVRIKATDSSSAIDPFLDFMSASLEPKITEPSVWLFILQDNDDVESATKFAASNLKGYDVVHSLYVPCKAEELYNATVRKNAPDVPLLFLFKLEDAYADAVRPFMKIRYETPSTCLYYKHPHRNTENKMRMFASELRIEFYLEILQSFAVPEENVVGVYTGTKFCMAAKMFGAFFYGFCEGGKERERETYLKTAVSTADNSDMNDFLHSNSPYSLEYIKHPRDFQRREESPGLFTESEEEDEDPKRSSDEEKRSSTDMDTKSSADEDTRRSADEDTRSDHMNVDMSDDAMPMPDDAVISPMRPDESPQRSDSQSNSSSEESEKTSDEDEDDDEDPPSPERRTKHRNDFKVPAPVHVPESKASDDDVNEELEGFITALVGVAVDREVNVAANAAVDMLVEANLASTTATEKSSPAREVRDVNPRLPECPLGSPPREELPVKITVPASELPPDVTDCTTETEVVVTSAVTADDVGKMTEPEIVMLSSDDDIDHRHESDDDENDDKEQPPEVKVVIGPKGKPVKIEKDFWKMEEERRIRRIARKKEREETAAKLEAAMADSLAASQKLAALELQRQADAKAAAEQMATMMTRSQAQFSLLEERLSSLTQALQSQSQGTSVSGPATSPIPATDVSQTSSVPQGIVPTASQDYRRVDDNLQSTPTNTQDLVASTPVSQVPVSYHRLGDNTGADPASVTEGELPSQSSPRPATSANPYDDKVDYGDGEDELSEDMRDERVGGENAAVASDALVDDDTLPRPSQDGNANP